MPPHPVQHSAFLFHNTYLGWTIHCNYYKNACINRLWQPDFWMKARNFAVRYCYQQMSMKATILGIPGRMHKKECIYQSRFCDRKRFTSNVTFDLIQPLSFFALHQDCLYHHPVTKICYIVQVSISPTLYAQLFLTKVLRKAFLYLDLRFVLFWRKNIGA